jgi:lipoprotein-releasing system permease protein
MFDTDLIWWSIPIYLGLMLLVICILAASSRLARAVATRYLTNFRLSIVSTITLFSICGTTLAVAALTVVTGISTGFQAEFQRKVLGVNAHVLVLKYLDFSEYRHVMEQIRQIPGVAGVNPFVINEMMVVHGPLLAGVLLKGVDPELMPTVLDLPDHIVEGSTNGLRLPGRQPPVGRQPSWGEPWPDDELIDDFDDQIGVPGVTPGPRRRHHTPAEILDDAVAEALEVDTEPPGQDLELPGIVPTRMPEAGSSRQVLDEAVADALEVEIAPPAPEQQPEELPGIVLGRTLARELDAQVGDSVRVVTPLAGLDISFFAPDSQGPRSREFRVIGIFYSGFDEYDTRLVYVDLYEAQEFFDHGDVVTGVEIKLDDPEDAPAIAVQVNEVLGGSPYRIIDWEQLNHNLFTALRIQKLALTIVVSLLVVVSGLLIAATLVMMIFEKKREIAILKAIGATNGTIMAIFLLVGSVVGAIGTAGGVGLGYGLCRLLIAYGWPLDPEVYLIDHLPVEIVPLDYVWVSTIALVICIVSTVFPAWITAASMKPVDGLRYE